jgi:demethylmenaquinone methyltransferase/2-methoxy-6-polyprenyl-1,4-benzoquinol methylase
MFDNIAGRYDFLNHLLSLGIDRIWRKRTIALLKPYSPKQILDVATGTGDLAITALKLQPESITGVDLSENMLAKAAEKIRSRKLEQRIHLIKGDSEQLPFDSNKFDAVTVGFGVRNFENLQRGILEIHRVLKPGGVLAVLEFSRPHRFPVKQVFSFYFRFILPLIGRLVSKDKRAYTYLPESVKTFPEGNAFLSILQQTGFKTTRCKTLFFGVASIYSGVKQQ